MAGFRVVGVDIKPQPRYCGDEFIQADALEYVREHGWRFDAIHASPPCQAYSDLAHFSSKVHPQLIEPVRHILMETGKPYVIENVEGSPLRMATVLCGTMFSGLRVIRHRVFESSVFIWQPEHKPHPLVKTTRKDRPHYKALDETKCFVSVTGGGNCGVKSARDAMGIDWMTKKEINQSIPPAYTEFIGRQLIRAVSQESFEYEAAELLEASA